METTKAIALSVRRATNRLARTEMFTWGKARTHVERLESRRLLAAWTLQPVITDELIAAYGSEPESIIYVSDEWGYRWQATFPNGDMVEDYVFKAVLDESAPGVAPSLEQYLSDIAGDLQVGIAAATGDPTVRVEPSTWSETWDEEGNATGGTQIGFFGNGGRQAVEEFIAEEFVTDNVDAGEPLDGTGFEDTLIPQTTVSLADFNNWGIVTLTIDQNGDVTGEADGNPVVVTVDPDTQIVSVDGLETAVSLVRGRETGYELRETFVEDFIRYNMAGGEAPNSVSEVGIDVVFVSLAGSGSIQFSTSNTSLISLFADQEALPGEKDDPNDRVGDVLA